MALNVILMGPPGAGKGTQAERFARKHGLPKIATGDILREAVQSGSELGRRARDVMAQGRLVSDDIMIGIVAERLARRDAAPGFVLDGFPRTVPQAKALDGLMAGRDPLIIVDIVVPFDDLVRRLRFRRVCGQCGANADPSSPDAAACPKCGGAFVQRADDDESVVRERLRVYVENTRPLLDYYGMRPTFKEIDGAQMPDRVADALERAVATVSASRRNPVAAGVEGRA